MKLEPGISVTANVRLLRPLGEGGMGAVWVAEHLALGTEVAVKFLQGDYANDPNARSRFSQEAAASSQVKSAHVVKIYDYGLTETQVPFIVMELLEGTDLAHRIAAERKLPLHVVSTIISQLCKALERAHDKGVIHRDIKPENIFLASEGGDIFVKLLDFGIAKTEKLTNRTTGNRRSTMAGESLGTPFYMSPEQFRNSKQIDFRSDLWAVGVVVYEALTGTLPFVADTVSALAIIVNDGIAPPPSVLDPGLPKDLDAWFAKACARDAANRFQSARELSSALRVALGEAPETSPRDSLASISGPQRVIVSEGDIALRETAFATSSGDRSPREPAKKKPIAAIIVASLVVAIAIGSFVWLTKAPQVSPKGDIGAAALVLTATPTPAVSAIASSAPAASSLPSIPTVVASAEPTIKHPANAKPPASAKPAPSATGSKHDEIW